ncbi:ribosomal protein S18-alanine N-acetyltransferase [Fluviibacterium sp. DFM31]|uniref:[Ribosomal protein bS18]-alanine N-acetyltransferase n=1 Tax=Meridianimarinicoccus marinus TaxID=3231483 RepID=A0ABV3L2M6_9RHOB
MTPSTLAALHAACFTTPRPWQATEFADLLTQPVVFLESHPSGFALGRVIADEAELLTLAVDPAHRRAGIGQALMARFLDTACQRGAAQAFLEVAANNAPALALYDRCGFARAGLRRRYYSAPDGQKIDGVVMTRPIA